MDVVRFICRDGVYLLNNDNTFEKLSSFNSARYIKFSNNSYGYSFASDYNVYVTTNGGVNWNSELYSRNLLGYSMNSASFNQIAFVPNSSGKVFTRKLSTNLNTYYDNQSTSESLSFDWTNYSTPTNEYLRGGYSSLNCSDLINSGQSDEKIFYRWSDDFMKASHSIDTSNGKDFYFDASGTTIANYYKTKQLSTTSGAISSVGQTKVLKDEWGAINQIHQSLDGGIFYTKSYDNGGSYKREEIVNATTTHSIADGNKNPALCETNWYGTLAGGYPVNKNVTACWERYNSSNGMTEIKVAVRSYDIYTDTAFKWNNWEDGSYSDVFASFNSSSNYNSFPKIFASALDPVNYLGEPSTYFFAIPHLRPYQGGNKLVVSCRKGQNLAADFVLDSGDISDLAVVDTVGSPGGGAILIHFAYRKVNQILYRQELFQYQTVYPNSEMIGTYHYEGPKDVTTGDGGYPARLTPDISIMNGIPVITYAANYNAYRIVEFEDNTTTSLTVDRYPIVKVQRINANTWSNYVIYSSNNTQSSPDIEGSKTTRSYIINYNINNNQFKKVANVENYPGYFCSPNTFAGTDSRLVNNSYTGSFGSNMSLLTLSPQSSLYIIGKQNFVITNHNPIETFDIDNIQGVVSSDSIRYSFKLGPIFVQDNSSNEEIPVGPTAPPEQDPILTSIEFNENLRSQPFLLNETNPLLVSSNATYLKDNAYHSITEIPYTVKLINKRTDTLHRILYQDTIHAGDSMETEYMRGFYISDIPNGEDSFYVKLDVDETFNDAAYYVNPIYEDEYDTEGDNSGRSLAIIFENKNKLNVNSLKPNEYSLTQNYPNPFNPSTIIQYSIPNDVWVNVRVYDISGREISSLVNEFKTTGTYLIKFDGSNFASGIYFYRIEAVDNSSKKFVQTKRMVLVK